jgi:hypothetical protein
LPHGGDWMLKALFVMIVVSNEFAARIVRTFQRRPA